MYETPTGPTVLSSVEKIWTHRLTEKEPYIGGAGIAAIITAVVTVGSVLAKLLPLYFPPWRDATGSVREVSSFHSKSQGNLRRKEITCVRDIWRRGSGCGGHIRTLSRLVIPSIHMFLN